MRTASASSSRPCARHLLLAFACSVVVSLGSANALQAQAQRVVAADAPSRDAPSRDAPSRDAASKRIGDSLTVHRLRRPKAKPAGTEAGSRASASAKHTGTIDTLRYPRIVETPLPTRSRKGSTAP